MSDFFDQMRAITDTQVTAMRVGRTQLAREIAAAIADTETDAVKIIQRVNAILAKVEADDGR